MHAPEKCRENCNESKAEPSLKDQKKLLKKASESILYKIMSKDS